MNDTICAIATVVGNSSINVIRVSGDDSINIVNKIFSGDLTKKETNTITYGFIKDKNEKIDEVLVSIFKKPKSFTTEDIVEINTHGGTMSVNKIMELLLTNGCRQAEPGEFLKRAFLNGRIDLVEAEAVSDMILSRTEASRKMAMKGINKDLSNTNTSTTYPIKSYQKEGRAAQYGRDKMGYDEMDAYREIIKENIEYDILTVKLKQDISMLDEIVDLLTETVCTQKDSVIIAGDVYPAAVVKSKLLKLNAEHIEYVLDCMKSNTTEVRNIKKYLLAALFNAPSTMDSYYTARVNHDLYGHE